MLRFITEGKAHQNRHLRDSVPYVGIFRAKMQLHKSLEGDERGFFDCLPRLPLVLSVESLKFV